MTPAEIVQTMYDKDAFSQWLGIEILKVEHGNVRIRMTVREEMVNGFGIAHGGISYSLADSAFAFASNSRGQHAVSIDTSIAHMKTISPGDVLIAYSEEIKVGRSTANYLIHVINQAEEPVALFKGVVFRLDKKWEI